MANPYQDKALAAARQTLKDTEPMKAAASQVRKDTAKPVAPMKRTAAKPPAKGGGMRGYIGARNRAISGK